MKIENVFSPSSGNFSDRDKRPGLFIFCQNRLVITEKSREKLLGFEFTLEEALLLFLNVINNCGNIHRKDAKFTFIVSDSCGFATFVYLYSNVTVIARVL